MGVKRVHSAEFKRAAVERMLRSDNVRALCRELGLRPCVLYRWRDAYEAKGAAGLITTPGRPRRPEWIGDAAPVAPASSEVRIQELERKIGEQALDLDFLQRAFKRVKASQRKSTAAGATASTEKSAR